MKNALMLAALMTLPTGLSGCGKKVEGPQAEVTAAVASDGAVSNMEMTEGSKMGEGSGTVTAVDTKAGMITLDHGPIPGVNWPAMKMGFMVKPAILSGIAVGDKVAFEVTVIGNAGEITHIKKQ